MACCALASVLAGIAGCATQPAGSKRLESAHAIATSHGWLWESFTYGGLPVAYVRPSQLANDAIQTVYIEGDGLAWLSAERPSIDPTPLHPIALLMALAHPASGAAVYLSRPCQFVVDLANTECRTAQWTDARFSQQIIDVMSAALDRLKQNGYVRSFQLIGYSGGGAVAVLLAAQRQDVVRVVTVAGNLDTNAWTALHRVTPLTGSLNPADAATSLQHVMQIHLVGAKDLVMPPEIAQSYVKRFAAGDKPQIQVIENFEHRCCWAESWPELWSAWVGDPHGRR